MRISDWSSDVCSSDLLEDRLEEVPVARVRAQLLQVVAGAEAAPGALDDDHADRLVGRDAIERLLQRAHESAGAGVVLTGPVGGLESDAVAGAVQQQRGGG